MVEAERKVKVHDRSSGGSRVEVERRLIQRSLEGGAFRQRLLDDPSERADRCPKRCA